jgi:hypothetical protein
MSVEQNDINDENEMEVEENELEEEIEDVPYIY